MKTTYNWLKQYIDLKDITIKELVKAVTKSGLEVETYEYLAQGDNLVIGQVNECVNHPNSDHLHICQVNIGNEVTQIVCGAPNVRKGQKVIVALPGCKLVGGVINAGVIRDEESNGMICSLSELGVDKHSLTPEQLSGIEVLSDDAEVGNKNVLAYLGLDDVVFDISLTPNRADCYSMWALAKDIGATLNRKVSLPEYSYQAEEINANLTVESMTEKCPHFIGKVINEVTIKPSPQWLRQALTSIGIKSINNVVDISNYVMVETGQPLHFYDLAKLPTRDICVKDGLNETYTALDGIEYQVMPQDIMITSQGKAIGYAGIMGGEDSKIDEQTTGIIIEAASFDLASIRSTSRRLNLITEAATRFSKGINPLAAQMAVTRSTQLLIELADAKTIEKQVEWGSDNYSQLTIDCYTSQINSLLGTCFDTSKVEEVFKRLDFDYKKVNDDKLAVTIPAYRTDISLWQDLSEEVIRILGYENIISTLPLLEMTVGDYTENGKNKRLIKQMLNGFGYDEVINYSLVNQKEATSGLMNIGEPVRILNALSEDRRYYRTSLTPSILKTIAYNEARNNYELAIFEMGDVYDNKGNQKSHLVIASSSNIVHSLWQKIYQKNDFYALKGIIIEILNKLGYDEKRIKFVVPTNEQTVLQPNKMAEVHLDNQLIGVMGVSHPITNKEYDIEESVIAELDLDAIFAKKFSKIKYTSINKYPAIVYDLSLLVDEDVTGDQITSLIGKAGGRLLRNVTIFDVYQGDNIEKGKKSIAVKLQYQSDEKTLSEVDIIDTHRNIIQQLNDKLKASIREN